MPKKFGPLPAAFRHYIDAQGITLSKKADSMLRSGQVSEDQVKRALTLVIKAGKDKLTHHHLKVAGYNHPPSVPKGMKKALASGKRVKVPKMLQRIIQIPKLVSANQTKVEQAMSVYNRGEKGKERLSRLKSQLVKSLSSGKPVSSQLARYRRDTRNGMIMQQIHYVDRKENKIKGSSKNTKTTMPVSKSAVQWDDWDD